MAARFRFPHNSRFSDVHSVLDPDLLASTQPLVIAGFASLDSLLTLLTHPLAGAAS